MQVLAALARVLHLDEVEHRYLLDLAEPAPRPRPRRRVERVPARLHGLLAAVAVPAHRRSRARRPRRIGRLHRVVLDELSDAAVLD